MSRTSLSPATAHDDAHDNAHDVARGRPRHATLDALRVVAMVSIVDAHLHALASPTHTALQTWKLTVFLVLAGYLWSERRDVGAEVRQRWRTLLLPCLTWTALVGVATWVPSLLRGDLRWKEVARAFWGGEWGQDPFWAFWFPPALFVACVAYRLLQRLRPGPRVLLVLAPAATVAYLPGDVARFLPLSIAPALLCLVWVAAGHTLRRLEPRSRGGRLRWGVALLAVAIVADRLSPRAVFDLKILEVGTPLIDVAIGISVAAGLVLLVQTLPERWFAGFWSQLARPCMVVLLVHVPLGFALGVIESPTPLGVVAVIGLSWGIGLLLLRLPGAAWLTGQPAPRPARSTGCAPVAASSAPRA